MSRYTQLPDTPERDKLRATDPKGLADAWAMIEDLWKGTVTRAREVPEPVLHERVNGEWSFVQTHRHLVLVADCWLRRKVKGMANPVTLGVWRDHGSPCSSAFMWSSRRSGSTIGTPSGTSQRSRRRSRTGLLAARRGTGQGVQKHEGGSLSPSSPSRIVSVTSLTVAR
jgi:hypothetical protein